MKVMPVTKAILFGLVEYANSTIVPSWEHSTCGILGRSWQCILTASNVFNVQYSTSLQCISIHTYENSWSHDSGLESSGYFCPGPRFSSHHLHSSSQTSVIPVPGDQSLFRCVTALLTRSAQPYAGITHILTQ